MKSHGATGSLALSVILLATTGVRGADNISLSVNLIVTEQQAVSIGRATYEPPSGCLSGCYMWGNHRISGGTAAASWASVTTAYEREITNPANTGGCYRGWIEGWGSLGFYGIADTIQKCTPCVLWLETSGAGSVSGTPIGQSSYNCGAQISLTATAAGGWQFTTWSGSIASQSPSLTFTLDDRRV